MNPMLKDNLTFTLANDTPYLLFIIIMMFTALKTFIIPAIIINTLILMITFTIGAILQVNGN